MEFDLLDAYQRASEWTGTKVAGATTKLDAATLCDGWDVRTLMNHMLDTQRYFVGTARGENVPLPLPDRSSTGVAGSSQASKPLSGSIAGMRLWILAIH